MGFNLNKSTYVFIKQWEAVRINCDEINDPPQM